MSTLKGTFPVLITPMKKNGEIDLETLKKNLDWYIEEEIPGVCILGSTGEFSSLSMQERFEITEVALTHINKRIKCIVGTAAETTKDTITLTKKAKDMGADAVLIINPYYSLPTPDELYSHYKSISDSVDIPIMVYNNPPHTGVDMNPEIIKKLFEIENVKYIKDASGDLRRISDFARVTDGKINIFCGGEDLTLENFLLGATGWISVSGNIIPRETKMLFEYIEDGNIEKAKELFNNLYPLLDMLENGSKPLQRVKEALKLIGRNSGETRLPRGPLTKDEKAEVKVVLEKVGILNTSNKN